ncbi:MAG: preprotein translocase subunit SecG [Cytophagales bacterium]|nr:preprotein translocase subunit SecG [Cytophagales bacterium]
MYTLILVICIFISAILILSVLVQSPKGEGLSAQFRGGAASQIIGVKRSSDLIEKITWFAAASLISLVTIANLFLLNQQGEVGKLKSPNVDRIQVEQPDIIKTEEEQLNLLKEEDDKQNTASQNVQTPQTGEVNSENPK